MNSRLEWNPKVTARDVLWAVADTLLVIASVYWALWLRTRS